jgi:hypothetical protein
VSDANPIAGRRSLWILALVFAAVAILLVWAGIDGGREPLRTIVQPVALPGAGR